METIFSLITIKDIIDILLVATLLYYVYRAMKRSGALNIFLGVLAFVITWIVLKRILQMQLIGSLLDTFMNAGILILVIIFQDPIRRFLNEIGSQNRWRFIRRVWHKSNNNSRRQKWIMPIVYACMSMAKSKTGALIVIQQQNSLEDFSQTGDIIDAKVNNRLLENIFFKNSPLHDGAVIVAGGRLVAAGCILPVSHNTDLPRYLGLRHRSALGISQATDAIAIVVSEETGNISYAYKGDIHLKLSSTELEHSLSELIQID